MMNPVDAFSSSYAQARGKLLAAAASANLPVTSHVHPLPGRDGEVLAMDVVLDGAPDAQRLLIVSSACHGVEGYCGSGLEKSWKLRFRSAFSFVVRRTWEKP